MSFVLHYGDQTLSLANSDEIDIVLADIERAVRAGGGWVGIETQEHGVQQVLFTPGLYIRITEP